MKLRGEQALKGSREKSSGACGWKESGEGVGEVEQEELGLAKVMLSLVKTVRNAAKIAEVAGVAESKNARPATYSWAAL